MRDITFIGSGISSSFTILRFLEKLESAPLQKKVLITVVEKYDEFFTGIPYGKRSGSSVLLITSLRNFLPEPELGKFLPWLNNNKKRLLAKFLNEGGELSKEWVKKHQKALEENKWEDLFIPRRFFGLYMAETLKKKINTLTAMGCVEVELLSSEITDLQKEQNCFEVLSEDNSFHSKKVVVCVGSLPVKTLWKTNSLEKEENLLFVNNPYKPQLKSVLDEIKSFLSNREEKETNAVIIGANASGLELIYKLNDEKHIGQSINHFTMISTQGLLPDSEIDFKRQKDYKPKNLKQLSSEKNLTADKIAEATYKDLDLADSIKLGAASTVGIVSKAFGNLLVKLDINERRRFACHYGNDIGRRQRCAGKHYSDNIDNLKIENRFEHIAGRYNNMILEGDDEPRLRYLETKTKEFKQLRNPVNLVINCVGGMSLDDSKVPHLIKNLISKGYCKPNESRIGFEVDENLEAQSGLHIMGPLLAGNVIEDNAVWHVEHCGRIVWLSAFTANVLYDFYEKRYGASNFDNEQVNASSYVLKVKKLDQETEIEHYKSLLKQYWNNNIYYTYEHISYFKDEHSKMYYFLLEDKDGAPVIIMPFVLRNIVINGIVKDHFDVITPYGYSGPLFDKSLPSVLLKRFWEKVDKWYGENKVVTEFVRFSLNENYNNYSGTFIPSLNNVKGKLFDTEEVQWTAYNRKVRNNYRKAQSFDLTFKIFEKEKLNEAIIKQFHDIYLDTMNRNNASSIYFFDWVYFRDLILNNIENFAIALVFKDDKAISTELVIHQQETILAFLGGTDHNFFECRPNDFLRVEVVKWAIKNGKKHYVLGGGIKNKDGLYKHKKAMFPKDDDVVFYTGRKVIDQKIYGKLCYEANQYFDEIPEDQLKYHFFPFYRAEQLIQNED